MQITQVTSGRFWHFHLARQLERHGLLRGIWSSYPHYKLRDEQGIDPSKVHSVPHWLLAYAAGLRVPALPARGAMLQAIAWRNCEAVDRAAARSIREPTIVVGLSASGLHAGRKAQALGGRFVCDRGSSHIGFQHDLLTEEYRRWGFDPPFFHPRAIAKEEAEYAEADRITVPSSFAVESFVQRGIPAEKMRLMPYGARLDRFAPQGAPDPEWFTLLFVGEISVRKGLPYLLQAFARFRHPAKRLRIIGPPDAHAHALLAKFPTTQVELLGQVPNDALPSHYSSADAMVLPSIEDGFGLVMGEALACGCPVIASRNTGAAELFEDGVEGHILPIRDVDALVDAFTALADDPGRRSAMRAAARARVGRIGGWDSYGDRWAALAAELSGAEAMAA